MMYITGDCHGDFRRFNKDYFPEQKEMTKGDYVIICGDFGGIWNKDFESKEEKIKLDWLDSLNFTTLFVSGNHENFDRLYNYPVEEWHGGKVQRIRSNIIHLMRGQVYEISGKRIFSFGGASSHDIDGGILELSDPDYREKKQWLDIKCIPYRINHLSWWEQELPSEEEMNEGWKNLERHNFEVDYIITHCCASRTQIKINHFFKDTDLLTEYLEEI